jgi:hypothetical protein
MLVAAPPDGVQFLIRCSDERIVRAIEATGDGSVA